MATFKQRANEVEAWLVSAESALEIARWLHGSTCVSFPQDVAVPQVEVLVPNGVTAVQGEWVVCSGGAVEILPDDEFKQRYEPVDGERRERSLENQVVVLAALTGMDV